MRNELFHQEVFHPYLHDRKKLLLIGWYTEDGYGREDLHVLFGDEEGQLDYFSEDSQMWKDYFGTSTNASRGLMALVSFKEETTSHSRPKPLRTVIRKNGSDITTAKVRHFDWKKTNEPFIYYDRLEVDGEMLRLTGWYAALDEMQIDVKNKHGEAMEYTNAFFVRHDINRLYPELPAGFLAGFMIQITPEDLKSQIPVQMTLTMGKLIRKEKFTRYKIYQASQTMGDAIIRLPRKFIFVLKRDGIKEAIRKSRRYIANHSSEVSYKEWVKQHTLSNEELKLQREAAKKFEYRPKFSIVVPMYHTDEKFLKELVDSIQAQTYDNWELCLADAGRDENGHTPNEKDVKAWAEKDPRIVYKILDQNRSIAENTNDAILMASGDYIVFSDHDDLIEPDALYENAKAINEDRNIEVLYSDQDNVELDGKTRYNPYFKPDFNLDYFTSTNYISHLFVVKKSLVDQVGLLNPDYDGSQDYEFTFRCIENAKRIYHIPLILYHWRVHMESTAGNPESKHYAFVNGKRAIDDHYKRMGIPAETEITDFYGIYRTHYHWPEKPLVSILIPTKDHTDDLDRCVQSILKNTDYPNYEIILIENNSTEDGTFEYYKKIEEDPRIHVVYYKGGFNYSKINNFGFQSAKGEYILLLNNDTEVLTRDWMDEMLGYCMRSDVGAVGAKLLYPDDTIQHGGIVIGLGGVAANVFCNLGREDFGFNSRLLVAQDYSAVTAACLLTKRSVFEEVGMLSEDLSVAFNDVDYCMKVGRAGYRIVWTPYAELYHYESKSRGYETTPEKRARYEGEVAIFCGKWRKEIEAGDPAYNPNLTTSTCDFALRRKNEGETGFGQS